MRQNISQESETEKGPQSLNEKVSKHEKHSGWETLCTAQPAKSILSDRGNYLSGKWAVKSDAILLTSFNQTKESL